MKSMSLYTGPLLLLVCAAAQAATNTFFIADGVTEASRREIGEWVYAAFGDEATQPGDRLNAMEAPSHRHAATVVVPKGSASARFYKPKVNLSFGKIVELLKRKDTGGSTQVDFTRIPETVRLLHRPGTGRHNIIIVGDPVYRSVEDNREWDFIRKLKDGAEVPQVPTAGVLAPESRTPFAAKTRLPKDTWVYWIALNPKWAANEHADAINNFLSCYWDSHGARFFGVDASIANTLNSIKSKKDPLAPKYIEKERLGVLTAETRFGLVPVDPDHADATPEAQETEVGDSQEEPVALGVEERREEQVIPVRDPATKVDPEDARGVPIGIVDEQASVAEETKKPAPIAKATPPLPQRVVTRRVVVPPVSEPAPQPKRSTYRYRADREGLRRWWDLALKSPRYSVFAVSWRSDSPVDVDLHVSANGDEVSKQNPRFAGGKGGLLRDINEAAWDGSRNFGREFEIVVGRDLSTENLAVDLNKYAGGDGPVDCRVAWVVDGKAGSANVRLNTTRGDRGADTNRRGPSLNWINVDLARVGACDCDSGVISRGGRHVLR